MKKVLFVFSFLALVLGINYANASPPNKSTVLRKTTAVIMPACPETINGKVPRQQEVSSSVNSKANYNKEGQGQVVITRNKDAAKMFLSPPLPTVVVNNHYIIVGRVGFDNYDNPGSIDWGVTMMSNYNTIIICALHPATNDCS